MVAIETTLEPPSLLERMQALERKLRTRPGPLDVVVVDDRGSLRGNLSHELV